MADDHERDFERQNNDLMPGGARLREVAWDAPEHHHIEKTSDWFWALGIIVLAFAVAMIVFGNVLFGIIILLSGGVMALIASKGPRTVTHSVSLRGIRLGKDFYPYSSLRCFFLDETHPRGVQLLVASNDLFTPMLTFTIPDEAVEDIEDILEHRLPEEHLTEPIGHRILELFGF